MELELIFEHLTCKAFNCERRDFYFADADHFRNAQKHLGETKAFMIASIILLCKSDIINGCQMQTYIERISDCNKSNELAEILQELYTKNIIL